MIMTEKMKEQAEELRVKKYLQSYNPAQKQQEYEAFQAKLSQFVETEVYALLDEFGVKNDRLNEYSDYCCDMSEPKGFDSRFDEGIIGIDDIKALMPSREQLELWEALSDTTKEKLRGR